MTKEITIAIGDIHGIAWVLDVLLQNLESRFSGDKPRFIFLGDVIDRGEHSLPAMNMVCATIENYPGSVLVLGNHDEYLLRLLKGELSDDDQRVWMMLGGIETLQSYAVDHCETDDQIRVDLERIRPKHVALLKSAVSMVLSPRHCFVHAGINPARPLNDQSEKDLRYIRKGFLDHTEMMERIIVHGHSITPSERPEVFRNRIAIDTGSYRTGRISAAIFENDILTGFVSAEVVEGKAVITTYDPNAEPVAAGTLVSLHL